MRSPFLRFCRYVSFCAGLAVLIVAVHVRDVRAAAHDMQGMGGHMTMTELRPIQPGDQSKADAIVKEARKAADQYTDFHKALADGYVIFHPEIKQEVYHFTYNAEALQRTLHFDSTRPTSLLYEKTSAAKAGGEPGYKLVGVMYTAPYRASLDELDRRVPLSIARWHLHTNLCVPPMRDLAELAQPESKFGLQGSITTAEACQKAGGTFLPHVLGWMVHVYPYEKDPAKIWATGMDDDHGMQHDAMPEGMNMPM
jgi:hypothetical protein